MVCFPHENLKWMNDICKANEIFCIASSRIGWMWTMKSKGWFSVLPANQSISFVEWSTPKSTNQIEMFTEIQFSVAIQKLINYFNLFARETKRGTFWCWMISHFIVKNKLKRKRELIGKTNWIIDVCFFYKGEWITEHFCMVFLSNYRVLNKASHWQKRKSTGRIHFSFK